MKAFDKIEILLVDDNRLDADLTIRALVRSGVDNRVFWVHDGVEALQYVRCTNGYASRDPADRPKLLLLDLKMPRLNGLDVLRDLKSDEATRAIPIVVLTSSNQQTDIDACYRLGANGFVTKPMAFADLEQKVGLVASYWLHVNQVP